MFNTRLFRLFLNLKSHIEPFLSVVMKVLERNVLRLAVVQHLRSVYGIKIKNWNKTRNKQTLTNTVSS